MVNIYGSLIEEVRDVAGDIGYDQNWDVIHKEGSGHRIGPYKEKAGRCHYDISLYYFDYQDK